MKRKPDSDNFMHALEKILHCTQNALHEESPVKTYQLVTETLREISGAMYVAFCRYHKNTKNFTLTNHTWDESCHDIPPESENRLFQHTWSYSPKAKQPTPQSHLLRFGSPDEIQESIVPRSVSKILTAEFEPNEVVIISIEKRCLTSGFFLLLLKNSFLDDQKLFFDFCTTQLALLLNLKKTREQLLHAQLETETAKRAKSQFLGSVSDEIRTPLNGVIGSADLMMTTKLTKVQKSFMNDIITSAVSLMDLFNDILDLSKIESGQLELNPELTDILELCNVSVNQYKSAASKKGLKIALRLSPEVPRAVFADTIRLPQVLNNLMSNAIKFTKKGEVQLIVKPVEVNFADNIVNLMFSVQDTGIGISAKDQEKVFKLFSQVDASNKKKFGGTGLGLVVSKRIVEKMNGEIFVESEPGKGSTFSFIVPLTFDPDISGITPLNSDPTNTDKLPVSRLMEGHEKSDTKLTHPVNMGSYKILSTVADQVSLSQINSIFENYFPNTLIIEVINGEEARKKIKEHSPDVMLLDLQMPALNGYKLTKSLRESEKESGKHIPVLAISKGIVRNEKQKCLKAGMNGYFLKPIYTESFLEELNHWLNLKPEAQTQINQDMEQEGTLVNFNREDFLERCGGDKTIANKMLSLSKNTFDGYIKNLHYY
ncbi:MAG TPA: response regulator, partial [Bacteroidales bacterium]|nr:response regulator [Bacteroidales bacterium]